MKRRILLLLIAFLTAWGGVLAQEIIDPVYDARLREILSRGADRLECRLVYPRGSSTVVWELDGNAGELGKLDYYFSDKSPIREFIKSVSITSYSSVEGEYPSNELLAKKRAFSFRDALNQIYGVGYRFPTRTQWVAEDWDGLREQVEASSMEYKSEITYVIDNVGIFEGREKQLMDLSGGVPYRYMLREMFPKLRHIEILIEYDLSLVSEALRQRQAIAFVNAAAADAAVSDHRTAQQAVPGDGHFKADTQMVSQHDTTLFPFAPAPGPTSDYTPIYNTRSDSARVALRSQRREDRRLTPLLSIGTDLVRDGGVMSGFDMGVPTANLSAEVYFARRWSVQGSVSYSNWEGFDAEAGHRGVDAYELSPRFWFSRGGMFRGLFVGVYGQYGSYDMQKEALGNTGTFWGAGLGVGYVQTLSRQWYLELEVRGGYRSAANDLYDIEPGHYYYNSSTSESKIVPAARLSIVYRFGRP